MTLHPFTSRVQRRTFALWWLLSGIAGVLLEGAVQGPEPSPVLLYFALAFAIAILALVAEVGRLHDVDRSGWWLLLNLVPVVNLILAIYLLLAPGTEGPNRFGPDPRGGRPESDISLPPTEPPQLRLVDWDGGAIRECSSCGLGNPETAYRCDECGASLSGTTPYIPTADPPAHRNP